MGTLQSYLSEHPRMMGVLFAVVLATTQAGTAVAGGCGMVHGP